MNLPPELDFAVDLESVKARAEALSYFLHVGTIREAVAAIEEQNAQAPSLYISMASEVGAGNELIGGYRQDVACSISFLFCEASSVMYGDGDDIVTRTKLLLTRQFLNWQPRNATEIMAYDRYLLRATGDGFVWGEVLFRTAYTIGG